MGFFASQLPNIIEWEQYNENMIFWKWNNNEIKRGTRLIIRPGQDAIFMSNGKIEGVFADEGSYDIESEIVPFLSNLKGFKFGFNTGMRAEVLFINTKEFTVKWGTKNAINIPAPNLPGGMPIKSFGTFSCKVSDYQALIDKVAGIKKEYLVDDVKERIVSMLDQTFMNWVVKEGKDVFNIQANAAEISNGIKDDLDMEMQKIGISITAFAISSVSYPKEVQEMATKAASQSMFTDMGKYTQMAMADSIASNIANNQGGGGGGTSSGIASDVMNMQMGMMMGQQMVNHMAQTQNMMNQQQMPQQNMQQQNMQQPGNQNHQLAKFCPNCGSQNPGSNFCPNCGYKLIL